MIKWETLEQIQERKCLTQHQTVELVRNAMIERKCKCRLGLSQENNPNLYQLDEEDAAIEADTDQSHSKSGMWD